MATQRIIVAAVAGVAGDRLESLFQTWRAGHPQPDPTAVDRLCEVLRDNAAAPPVVSFCEWIDGWLMGDHVPGPGAVEGRRYSATCLTPAEAMSWADRVGVQSPESERFAVRLREAAGGWGTPRPTVVVIREVIGPSITDDEVWDSLGTVPAWLTAL